MKIIVIGLGSMGKRRIRLVKSMYPDIKLIGIDKKESRVQEVEKLFDIVCYSSITDAVEKEQPECAFVCTAPVSHGKIIQECLQKGLHIFTEINLLSDLYDENMQLANEKKRLLFLSSTPIYRGEIKKIKEIVEKNGNPVHYIYHVGQYLPDWHPWENYKDFFVGDERTNGCREILAIELPWMLQTFGDILECHVMSGKLTSLDLKCNDSYSIILKHKNGSQGVLAVDVVCREAVRKLEIYNEELYITWNGKPDTLYQKDIASKELVPLSSDEYLCEEGYSQFVNEYAYINELQYFFDSLDKFKEKGSAAVKDSYGFLQDKYTLALIDRIEGKYEDEL